MDSLEAKEDSLEDSLEDKEDSLVAGDDIRQKLEFHHVHLELGALRYIETFLFYWSWGFFKKKTTKADFRF